MIFRSLQPSDLEAWYDHTGEVFASTGRQYFVNHVERDPSTDLADIFVAMDGDVIASTVRVFSRNVYFNGQVVRMGGIGEVSTKKAYRKLGLSSTLLEMAIARMEEKKFGISMLFTGVNPHYEKQGYMTVPRQMVIFPASKVERETLPGTCEFLDKAVSEDLLDKMNRLFDAYAPQFDGVIVRDNSAYVRDWVYFERKKMQGIALSQPDGELIAYLYAKVSDGQLCVNEFISKPEHVSCLSALANLLAEKAGVDKVEVPAVFDPNLAGDRQEDTSMMVRLITPFALDGMPKTTEQLVSAFDKPAFFEADGF